MAKYNTHFIPQNKAPINNDYIYVYNGATPIGKIKTSGLKMPELGSKLYSFGALSDVHVTYGDLARTRFKNAIKFLTDEEKVAFTCIAGDLTSSGTADQFRSYISATEEAKNLCTRTAIIHDTTGNHDVEQGNATINYLQDYADGKEPYASRELYYSFMQGNDLFIMFGMTGWPGKNGNSILFSDESMVWLENLLNANKNRRIFLFEHCPYFVSANGAVTDGIGAIVGLAPPTGGYIASRNHAFMKLMEANPNVTWFHGHTHIPFYRQAEHSGLNYASGLGFHIPSSATGRIQNSNGGWGNNNSESWGCVVDVYKNHIVVRGCDLVTNKFVPIATYCLDTTLQTIEANTVMDSTGTITS
jgi:predicted phosphodiesterase